MVKNTFTTVNGIEVRCKAVPDALMSQALAQIEVDYRNRKEPIDPPTYEVPLAGGGTETHVHDATTLVVPESEEQTKANQAAWAAYEVASAKLAAEQKEKQAYLFLMAGLDFVIPNDGWVEMQQVIFGITPPEDPAKRRWHYIQTVLLTTFDDITNAMEIITMLTYSGQVDQEAVRQRIKSFRDNVQGKISAGLAKTEAIVEAQSDTK